MITEEIRNRLAHVSIVGLVGRPGCGKEFTGNELVKNYKIYGRIIMSSLIHAEIARGTSLGMEMKQYLDSGNLVPDNQVTELFLNEAANLHKEGFKIILADGFPRNVAQQRTLHELGIQFSMFFIELPTHLAIERMLLRKRPGEDVAKCEHRQRVFESDALPMIAEYRQRFPDSFRQINGALEAQQRAQEVHINVIQIGHTVYGSKAVT